MSETTKRDRSYHRLSTPQFGSPNRSPTMLRRAYSTVRAVARIDRGCKWCNSHSPRQPGSGQVQDPLIQACVPSIAGSTAWALKARGLPYPAFQTSYSELTVFAAVWNTEIAFGD